jgi:DNA mismatch endonuclease (patch repair protein)
MDRVTPETRSAIMARIRGKNTKPELIVRSLAHGLGFRYRLHQNGLPGKPDLVFAGRKKIIFVNGCFWHWHQRCGAFRPSKSRIDYWESKLTRNRERDICNGRELRRLGWKVLTIWECQVHDTPKLEGRIRKFLLG